ncbi:MAG TPA: efflux RND transporter permease subunit [Candidatus Hydrogenedentes bacterium]|nr:efflux RND transporter permease subunit [Candidatus Hydrogenedentota bacterium]
MRSFFTSFARNIVFANILLAFIFFGGYLAITNMARETFPDIHLDMIQVAVVWPGADPEEVEEGISRKIEEALDGIEGIKEYNTISNENVGLAIIEVQDGYETEWVQDQVRNAVDTITTFPANAERPIVREFLLRIQVMLLSVTGPELTEVELKELAEDIKDDIRSLPEVTQVQVMSSRVYEIAIEISEERLRQYGITFDQVAQVVRANSLNVPGGVMRTEGEEIRLRTVGRNYTAEEFANIVVLARPDGKHITLDRIANIRDGFEEENAYARFNGKDTVTISILKTQREDMLTIDRAIRDYLDRKRMELPEGVTVEPWARMSPLLEERIRLLVRNGILGLVLVFVLLWLFLDIRLSFWAGMGMPVSVLGSFMFLWWYGGTINMISLFAVIAVLGIIVDDAIIVGEAIYVARKNGLPPLQAAVEGVLEVGMPVIAAVTTTMIAFVPLLYVGGFVGRLISVLPVVVIAALGVSLVECLFLLPAHLSHLPDPNAKRSGKGFFRWLGLLFHRTTNRGLERFVKKYYDPFIALALRWRYVSVSIAAFVVFVTWGIVDSGYIKFEFFPMMDGNSMAVVVEFPNGTPLDITEEAVIKIEEAVRELAADAKTGTGEPLLENIFSLVGAKLDERGMTELGTHFGTIRVELLNSVQRNIHLEELMAEWERRIGMLTGVIALTIRGDETGPPGRPVEVWMRGDNLANLTNASEELKEKLASFDGVYQIQDDFRQGKNEINLKLKPEARALGLHVADLARQVYTGYYGEEILRIQRGRNDVRVRVRYPQDERRQISDLERIRIRTALASPVPGMGGMSGMSGMSGMGGSMTSGSMPRTLEVPLLSVADIEYTTGVASIRRTNGQRRIVVTAEVQSERANASEIVRTLRKEFFPQLQQKYRDISMTFEGEQQEFREALDNLFIGFPLAVIGIFIIIATIFRSYIQPMVIMITVPFGMCGAIFGHILLGYDITMLSIFGLVALAGVVVNDAIVLIECINNYVAEGESFYEAVRRGGSRRFRAIFLTTITTVGGLTPLLLEKDHQAQVLIPMAISLASGVAFATVLTLLLVPCVLCILNDLRRLVFWLRTGMLPTPEEVEPARMRKMDVDVS